MRIPKAIAQVLLLVLVFSYAAFSAGEVDNSFVGNVSLQPSGFLSVSAIQSDGKILIGGNFVLANGAYRRCLVRLNSDGSTDTTFNPPEFVDLSATPFVAAIAFQANGKIIVAGQFRNLNTSNIVRLNTDGTLDASFNLPTQNNFNGSINDVHILADDRIIIGGNFGYNASGTGSARANIARLMTNGTTDETFAPGTGFSAINDLEVLSDGKILGMSTAAGGSSFSLRRLAADGSQDSGFQTLIVGSVGSIKALSDGKVLIAGSFTNVNNFPRSGLARLNADGSLDETFAPVTTAGGAISKVNLTADGKILAYGNFQFFNGAARVVLVRLNANGSLDETFNFNRQLGTTVFTSGSSIAIFPDGKLLMAGGGFRVSSGSNGSLATKLNSDGTYDTSFGALFGNGGTVWKTAIQPDGKILAAGTFGSVGQMVRPSIVRFNPDGTPDTTFNPTSITGTIDPVIRAIAVQADGKIIVGGQFFGMLYRLNSDGSRDISFAPNLSTSGVIWDVISLPDGKVIAVGDTTINGSGQTQRVVRFNPDGSVDGTFQFSFPNNLVKRILRASDGKLYIAGSFSQLGATIRQKIARLNADGSIDNSFNPLGGVNGFVDDIALQSDGKLILVGQFVAVNGDSRSNIARMNSNATVDPAFNPLPVGVLHSVHVQPDGKILIGGAFTSINGINRTRFGRLLQDGSLDQSFTVGSGADSLVLHISQQVDGKILIGGSFSRYNGSPRFGISRLLNAAAPIRTQFDFDGDGKADVSVFRASEGRWYILQSADLTLRQVNFAMAGDVPTPADFDGDGKTDIAIYRPSNGDWWSLSSLSGQQINGSFGQTGGKPLPSDFNGDGRADYIVYRPSGYWSRVSSANGQGSDRIFGAAGDKPVIGDFNGDGMSDPAIYRPSDGNWWWMSSADGVQRATRWGITEDLASPADYTGDGRTDFAVFRPSTGVWYIYDLANNASIIYPFGMNGDRPVSGDYDGDGRADTSVFRPSNGIWYVLRSTAGYTGYQWGVATDAAVPNVYVPQ